MNFPASLAFLSGAVGPGELVLIFLAVLLLFGPRRLPEIARTVGKIVNDLRRASQDFRDEIMRLDDPPPPTPPPSPLTGSGETPPKDESSGDSRPAEPEPAPEHPAPESAKPKDTHDLAG